MPPARQSPPIRAVQLKARKWIPKPKIRASGSSSASPDPNPRHHLRGDFNAPGSSSDSEPRPNALYSSSPTRGPGRVLLTPPRSIDTPIEAVQSRASGSRDHDPGVGDAEPNRASGSLEENIDVDAPRKRRVAHGEGVSGDDDDVVREAHEDHEDRNSLTLLFAHIAGDFADAITTAFNLNDSPAMVLLVAGCSEAHREFLQQSGDWVCCEASGGLCAFGKTPLCASVKMLDHFQMENGPDHSLRCSHLIMVEVEYGTVLVGGERSHRFGVGVLDALDSCIREASATYLGTVKDFIFRYRPLALAGDFHKATFDVTEYLDGGDNPLLVSMIANHAQYEITMAPLAGHHDWRPRVVDAIRFDTCAIFLIGLFHSMKRQGFARHALAGVDWTNLVMRHARGGVDFKDDFAPFGYCAQSFRFTKPPAPAVPEGLFTACCRVLQLKEEGFAPWEEGVTVDVLKQTTVGRRMFRELLDTFPKEAVVPPFYSPDRYREDWQLVPRGSCEELLCDSTKMDPHGVIVGCGGHVSLLAKISSEHHTKGTEGADDEDASALAGAYIRQRGKQGKGNRDVKTWKDMYWRKHNIWPHWVHHESEAVHWLGRYDVMVGNDPRGGGYDGLWWRFARQEWLDNSQEDEVRQYEQPWITANHEDNHVAALAATQGTFEAAQRRGESMESMLAAYQPTGRAKKMARKGADAAGKKGGSKGSAAGKKGGAAGKRGGAAGKGGNPWSRRNKSQGC